MRQQAARRRHLGEGVSEYIIIAALMTIAALSVVMLFGDDIRGMYGPEPKALAGVTADRTP